MNQNVTASFGLSVLTVAFFAVILYHPDHPPTPAPTPTQSQTAQAVPDVGPTPAPTAVPPAERLPAVAVSTKSPVAKPSAGSRLTARNPDRGQDDRVVPAGGARVARVVAHRDIRPAEAPEPRGAFTKARQGESLADVARRVYGSADQAKTLWLANRDILDRPDAPPRAGMLLRTP